MPGPSEGLERQITADVGRYAGKIAFAGSTAEDLWLWQANRRADLKLALAVELPTVYGPPKSRIIRGDTEAREQLQVWMVETEPHVSRPLYLQVGPQAAARPTAVVLDISESADDRAQEEFCGQMASIGLTGAASCLRAGTEPFDPAGLAEIYFGLGKSYAGAAVVDLLRIVDHLENQLRVEGEPIILVASGLAIPVGLALGAIDQRITGLVMLFDQWEVLGKPGGRLPLFVSQYVHLGPNPMLTLALCCVPRPLLMVNYPTDEDSWLPGNKSAVLSASRQLDTLRETYRIAGRSESLEVVTAEEDKGNVLDLLKSFLEKHFGSR